MTDPAMSDPGQYRFRDGELVRDGRDVRAASDADPVEPGTESGYRVEAKPGALDANATLREAVDEHGRVLEFGSRGAAERYAARLSASDGGLRVQAAAPNDPSDVDAYLLADHDPSVAEPASTSGATWTFDVGANLYGKLGEAVLTATPKPHALTYFVRQDLGIDDDRAEEVVVDVETDCRVSVEPAGRGERLTWYPDCVIVAKDGRTGDVRERYYCEIKTGNASFERSQVAAMAALAREERVLKARVLVDGLPDQYSLRIREVDPSDGD